MADLMHQLLADQERLRAIDNCRAALSVYHGWQLCSVELGTLNAKVRYRLNQAGGIQMADVEIHGEDGPSIVSICVFAIETQVRWLRTIAKEIAQ